ncbi:MULTISPECIES: MFS transporter [unclassified Pseudomonas]|uniref:MFS transporter n=1 Tax=unclassified Pseudomonas TaxID=196821 RepID=UPI0035BF8613
MSQSFASRTYTFLLWSVNLCAISASTLSYIYLSYYIYTQTENLLYSQTVLFAPMILPVLLVAPIYRLADRLAPRTLLWGANVLSLGSALVTYLLLPHQPWVAIVGAVLIGTLDAVQRVGRIVAIKCYFPGAQIASSVPLTLTAQFIAGGLAGISMLLFKASMSPNVALMVTATLFLIAALAAFVLPTLTVPPAAHAPTRLIPALSELIRSAPALRQRLYQFILFVSLFQGFFNVSRVLLPAHELGLGESGVGMLQAVNSVAALVGAIVFYRLAKRDIHPSPTTMTIISSLFMAIAAYAFNVESSYLSYFFYIFFFELAFFRLQAELVSHTPAHAMPLMASVQYAGVYLGMIITIFIGSLLVEWIGLLQTALIFACTYYIATYLVRLDISVSDKAPA